MSLNFFVFMCSVLDAEKWSSEPQSYDVISCLNAPLSMLRQIHDKLTTRGILILALVHPEEVRNH